MSVQSHASRIERLTRLSEGRRLRPLLTACRRWGHDPVALSLLAAAFFAIAFARITEDYVTNDPLARWDLSFARWLAGERTTAGVDVFQVVTTIGSPVVALLVATVVWVVLYRRRRLAEASFLPLALGGAELLNLILKLSFHRARPDVAFVQIDTYSFPSGHAMVSTAAYGALATLLWGRLGSRQSRIALLAGTIVVLGLIGFSRLYLGVHYLSDVLGGITAGAAWLFVSLAVLGARGERFAARLAGSRLDRLCRGLVRA